MKKFSKSKTIVFYFLLTSMILPLLPSVLVAKAQTPLTFTWGMTGFTGHYDDIITGAGDIQSDMFWIACELPVYGYLNSSSGTEAPIEEEWQPILMTDWNFTYWPSELNDFGFNNSGGIKAVTYRLRNNVSFHDGSKFDARAFKWNIDRQYIVSGNVTGNPNADLWALDFFWPSVTKFQPYWTPGYNMSSFDKPYIDPYGFYGAPFTPTADDYAGYYIGNETEFPGGYPGLTAVNGYLKNPNPYGGLDPSYYPINYAPYDRYPMVRYVEIVTPYGPDGVSGGIVTVHYNDWNTFGNGGDIAYQKSYLEYGANYTDQAIYGYENGVKDPDNPTTINHMVGTGPYKYVYSDENGGYMEKFDEYWNRAALEAEGRFAAERVEFEVFASSATMSTALLAGQIDGGFDSAAWPLDKTAIIADPDLDYLQQAPSGYLPLIVLNSVNETYWAWPGVEAWRANFTNHYYLDDMNPSNGIPQVLRKAINYAFNYDSMVNTKEGRALLPSGNVGSNSHLYNSSIPMPYFNLTYARELLLTTENDTSGNVYTAIGLSEGYNPSIELYNFSKRCADRGLRFATDNTTNNALWQSVATGGNPVWDIDFYWDDYTQDIKDELQTALYSIGVGLTDSAGSTNKITGQSVTDFIYAYDTFGTGNGMFSASAYPMSYYMGGNAIGYMDAYYRDYEHQFGPAWGLDHAAWRDYGSSALTGGPTPWWCFGNNYDVDIDQWIDRATMSNPVDQKIYASKIAEKYQTETFPFLWVYQSVGGQVVADIWNVTLYEDKQIPGFYYDYWGGGVSGRFRVEEMIYQGGGDGGTTDVPFIPGYSVFITVSLIAILGIISVALKKKKLR